MRERLEKSWVVEGPITATNIHCQYLEVKVRPGIHSTNLIARSAHEPCCSLQSLPITLSALFRNIIARTELDVRLFEVVFHPVDGDQFFQASRTVCSDVMASTSYSRGGSIVRCCDRAQSLAASGVIKVDLMGLLEGGELGAGGSERKGRHNWEVKSVRRKESSLDVRHSVCRELWQTALWTSGLALFLLKLIRLTACEKPERRFTIYYTCVMV